jgi:hypothetical protein
VIDVSDLQTSGPRARPGLDVNEVPDGLVIYDGASDRVHYLNPTAGFIFCFCTGENSEAFIAQQVGEHFSMDHRPTDETETCLADLRREGLID